MNLLYAIDDNFFPQTFVSIYSLLRYRKEYDGDVNIYIVSEGLNDENKNKLEKLVKENDAHVHFLNPSFIGNELKPDRGSSSQFYRLFVDEIFKEINISRVIYIDADTMITSSAFYNMIDLDMQGNIIGACIDPWNKNYKKTFNLKKDDYMFNSGILLIDLNAWRKNGISSRIRNIINNRKTMVQADQGILNETFKGEFLHLKPNYNVISSYFEFSYRELMLFRRPNKFYSEKEIKDAVENPYLIHFTSMFLHTRPWENKGLHPYSVEWKKILNDNNIKYKTKEVNPTILMKLDSSLPRVITLRIYGFLQAYVRPTIQKIRRK